MIMVRTRPQSCLTTGLLALLLLVLAGCQTGPKTKIKVVNPPEVVAALKVKTLAVAPFEGSLGGKVANDLEGVLSGVTVAGKPHFQVVGTSKVASAANTRSIAGSQAAVSVGQRLGADAVLTGRVDGGVTDNRYQGKESYCVRYEKKKVLGVKMNVCTESRTRPISCLERTAKLTVYPKLYYVKTRQAIYTRPVSAEESDKACGNRQIEDGGALLAKVEGRIVANIRAALAPTERTLAVRLMNEPDELHSAAAKESFKSAVAFVEAGRWERGCRTWRELERHEPNAVSLLYNLGLLMTKLKHSPSKLNIVVLDACRNNPFARSFRSGTRGLARVDAPSGSLVAYSTAPGNVARDGKSGGNSPYTSALVSYMRQPGLKVEDVFKKVRTQVHRVTGGEQTPWENSSLFDDFYFVRSRAKS